MHIWNREIIIYDLLCGSVASNHFPIRTLSRRLLHCDGANLQRKRNPVKKSTRLGELMYYKHHSAKRESRDPAIVGNCDNILP